MRSWLPDDCHPVDGNVYANLCAWLGEGRIVVLPAHPSARQGLLDWTARYAPLCPDVHIHDCPLTDYFLSNCHPCLVSLNSGGSSSSSSPLSDLAPLGSAILTSRRGSDPSSTLDQPWWPVRERKAGYSSSETTLGYDPWSDASSFAPIIRNYEQKEYTLPRPRPESYILPPPATKSRTPRVLQVEVFRRPVGSARSSFEAM